MAPLPRLRHPFIGLVGLALTLLLAACHRPPTDGEVFDTQASGVGLLTNRYYYSATLPTGQQVYFTGLAADGSLEGLTLAADSVKPATVLATAFFVGGHGEMLTSRRAAVPALPVADTHRLTDTIIAAVQAGIEHRQQRMRQRYHELEEEINSVITYDPLTDSFSGDAFRLDTLRGRQEELKRTFAEAQRTLATLRTVRHSEVAIEPHYRLTVSTASTGQVDCALVGASGTVDLALVRLVTGLTPAGAHVFTTPTQNGDHLFGASSTERERLASGEPLLMLGYAPASGDVGGVKVRLTAGSVALPPTAVVVATSLPAVSASAGSPVLNRYGELVAVSTATLGGSSADVNIAVALPEVKRFLASW